jgi:tetratricopeptide (TPR) repeat protein
MVARLSLGEGLWSAAEVWRALGRKSELRGMTDEAEGFYLRALETSRQQDAKAWELRASLSLARMWAHLDRPQQALQLLEQTCANAPDQGDPAITQACGLRDEIARSLPLGHGSPWAAAGPPHADGG